MTNRTPELHSNEVGGSTAARRIGCPDSRELEKIAPKSRSSVYARQGTALHEMMAIILQEGHGDDEINAMLPYTFHRTEYKDDGSVLEKWSYTVTLEEWEELGAPALLMFENFIDEIEAEYGDDFKMLIEVRGAFPGIPGAFGTSDVIWRCGAAGGCWDWKFGRTPVSAVENKQLNFYLNTAIYERPEFFEGAEEFILCISQPQVDAETHSEDVIGSEELAEFREELMQAMSSTGMAEGPWCQFADCAVICPLKTGKTARLGQLMEEFKGTQNGAHDENGAPLADTFDFPVFLAEALELMEAAGEWVKAVAGIAQQEIGEGKLQIEGWKTVDKKSAGREWVKEEDKVMAALSRRGLPVNIYAPRKVISPTQAEAALKKLNKAEGTKYTLPKDFVRKKPSSGTTLVREGDPRPSARTPATRAAELAAGLAKMADNMREGTENGE